jgi:hypothetical protein
MPKTPNLKTKPGQDLQGACFCIVGKMSLTRTNLNAVIKSRGGGVCATVAGKVTHLLSNEAEVTRRNPKVVLAQDRGLPIVSEDFLVACIKANAVADSSCHEIVVSSLATKQRCFRGNEPNQATERKGKVPKMAPKEAKNKASINDPKDPTDDAFMAGIILLAPTYLPPPPAFACFKVHTFCYQMPAAAFAFAYRKGPRIQARTIASREITALKYWLTLTRGGPCSFSFVCPCREPIQMLIKHSEFYDSVKTEEFFQPLRKWKAKRKNLEDGTLGNGKRRCCRFYDGTCVCKRVCGMC